MNPMQSRPITAHTQFDADIFLPASKSYTNRALICAALADGSSELLRPSRSSDTRAMIEALRRFNVRIGEEHDRLTVSGTGGRPTAPASPIHVGNAGTTMRFLTGFAALADGTTTLTGDERMRRRPIGELLDGLSAAGVRVSSERGFPPVVVSGGRFGGGTIALDAHRSSQFLSSLLLIAPYAPQTTQIRLTGQPSSLPYVDITLAVMRQFGAEVNAPDHTSYTVDHRRRYCGTRIAIEADASSASYFLAAAAVSGGRIRIHDCPRSSLQGDFGFIDVLRTMGAEIVWKNDIVTVQGRALRGVDTDMNSLPDCVPTLAVVASFAEGPTTIRRIGHLQYKESNRLQTIAAELEKIGATVRMNEDSLTVVPGAPRGAGIETYNDHRIAMSFAIAGLRIPGITISNPECVVKSFPGFWDEFRKLEEH